MSKGDRKDEVVGKEVKRTKRQTDINGKTIQQTMNRAAKGKLQKREVFVPVIIETKDNTGNLSSHDRILVEEMLSVLPNV